MLDIARKLSGKFSLKDFRRFPVLECPDHLDNIHHVTFNVKWYSGRSHSRGPKWLIFEGIIRGAIYAFLSKDFFRNKDD